MIVWNASNILSGFRLLLTIPAVYAVWIANDYLLMGIFAVATISDVLDGYLARKLNQVTEFGKVIDPLADKVLVDGVTLILMIQNRIPIWFGAIIIGRDVLILLGSLFAANKMKFVMPSNYIGKAAVVSIGLTLFGIIFHFDLAVNYGVWVVTFLVIASIVNYTALAVKQMKLQNKTN